MRINELAHWGGQPKRRGGEKIPKKKIGKILSAHRPTGTRGGREGCLRQGRPEIEVLLRKRRMLAQRGGKGQSKKFL